MSSPILRGAASTTTRWGKKGGGLGVDAFALFTPLPAFFKMGSSLLNTVLITVVQMILSKMR
jgi:hypothetical protein